MVSVSDTISTSRSSTGMDRNRWNESVSSPQAHSELAELPQIDRQQLNQALGWFSVGLGLVEVLAPRGLGRLIGTGHHPFIMRLCGLREIATGITLLSGRAPATSAMARVAGDAMDLALLGAALRSPDADPDRIAVAATAVMGVAAVDVYATGQHALAALSAAEVDMPVRVSVVINSPPEKLYSFWRDLENLPRFMRHLHSVTAQDERTSHWVMKAPAGLLVEWDSEIVEDQPNSRISWRTQPHSEVNHEGSVRFEPAGDGRGTIVHVEMKYRALGGAFGAKAAKLLGREPEVQIRQDLRTLKQLLETGEVATTRGQSSGSRSLLGSALTRREA